MSLSLDLGTKPKGLTIQTFGIGSPNDVIFLGDYEISMKDFLIAAEYVLTNTDLKHNDPRRQFVKCVQTMEEVSGYNPEGKRLKSSVLPVLPRKPRKNRARKEPI